MIESYQLMKTVCRHNVIFKDVYREVGLLEVFVTCLNRYATLLKDKQAAMDQGQGRLNTMYYTYCVLLIMLP